MKCDAQIAMTKNIPVVACELEADGHTNHEGVLRNHAYPGSQTVVHWMEDDRRNFHGTYPGDCPHQGCILPLNHPRGCAS